MSTNNVLTFRQAAEQLTESTGDVWRVSDIYRGVKAEQIPVVTVGRKRGIPAAWVADPLGWTEGES
ncbi:MAG: hypothetical protein ACRDNS_27785 [Trebonia sp.]